MDRYTVEKYKDRMILLLALLSAALILGAVLYRTDAAAEEKAQRELAGEVLRFHVLANSDSAEDQRLKLKVRAKKSFQILKVAILCLIAFFGAGFTIMAFNNDVQVHNVFSQIYTWLTGKESSGFTLLEISYCIGLGAGILIFYNHFGKKKLSRDPTPLEIEMRLYEDDIHTTLVEGVKRKNKHIDVD